MSLQNIAKQENPPQGKLTIFPPVHFIDIAHYSKAVTRLCPHPG